MNQQNFAIGILSVTATILLVGILLMGTLAPQEAQGYAQIDRGGDYVMLTSQWRLSDEVLWILDGRSQMLGLYYFNPDRARLELVRAVPLIEP